VTEVFNSDWEQEKNSFQNLSIEEEEEGTG
jgi:hypothetical protein